MNVVMKFFRSIREHQPIDASFESYYSSIAREQNVGGPTAAEARRDYIAVRESLERVSLF